jgi:hypothetical protein
LQSQILSLRSDILVNIFVLLSIEKSGAFFLWRTFGGQKENKKGSNLLNL